jgi:hypothetical protein
VQTGPGAGQARATTGGHRALQHHAGPVEKNNVAAANPDQVAALKKRANELAATMEKPLLLQAEFGAMRERLHMPPALPGEEASLNEED